MAGSGSAYADVTTGAAKVDGIPNPFADRTDQATGGREVIEKPTVADVMLSGALT